MPPQSTLVFALAAVASLAACKPRGALRQAKGDSEEQSAALTSPSQVSVAGHIAGREFIGKTIFARAKIDNPEIIETTIFTSRSNVKVVCNAPTDNLGSGGFYDNIVIWSKAAPGSYTFGGSDDDTTAHVEAYQPEGADSKAAGVFAAPAGTLQVSEGEEGTTSVTFEAHGEPMELAKEAAMKDYHLKGSYTVTVCD